jgi:microcystin-dependent protein
MPYTSNKKINALDLAPAPLGDNDAVPMVRAGVTYQTPLSAVEAKVFSAKTALSSAPLGTEVVILRQGDGSLRQTTTSSLIPDGNITNTQIGAAAAIADTKLATISSSGKVANSATTATSTNTANAIVARDGSGDFTARTITATQFIGPMTGTITGNASTASALVTPRTIGLSGAVTATGVSFDGTSNISLTTAIASLPDSSLAIISSSGKVANSATTASSGAGVNTIVARDGSGNFSAGTVTANLTGNVSGNVSGNSSTATTLQTGRTIALSGDVTGTAVSFNGSADITIPVQINSSAIVTADVADSAITTAKIADGAITGSKLNSSVILVPTGAVMPFAMNSAPTGWLIADGAEYSKTGIYAALFAAILTTYGETNGAGGAGTTHFRVPDLRGYFVRGAGTNSDATAAGTFGVRQADSVISHTHSGTTAGDYPDHAHGYTAPTNANARGGGSTSTTVGGVWTNTGGATARHQHDFTTSSQSPAGATETRPKNIALLYCIKF